MRHAVLMPRPAPRASWNIRTPSGAALTVEHDRIRGRWRVTPGGYERKNLRDAIAEATGSATNASWILELEQRINATLAAGSSQAVD